MLEQIIKKSSMIAPALAAALYCNSAVAQQPTQQELAASMTTINSIYFLQNPNDPRKKDWNKFVELIQKGEKIVLRQTADGKTFFGLDGWGQVLDPEYQQDSTLNGFLDNSEKVPNYTVLYVKGTKPEDVNYAFEGLPMLPENLPQMTIPVAIVPVPQILEVEKEPNFKVGLGVGFVNTFSPEEETYDFDGKLYGGKIFATFQPKGSNFYFGPEFMLFGNRSSAENSISAPAASGPLAGELVLNGANNYSLEALGIGAGLTAGYMFADSDFGIGLDLTAGFMHDWIKRELTENSSFYVNGNVLEGSEVNNTTTDNESRWNMYGSLGLRLKMPYVCVTPSVGLRTNFDNTIAPVFGVGAGYCPQ